MGGLAKKLSNQFFFKAATKKSKLSLEITSTELKV